VNLPHQKFGPWLALALLLCFLLPIPSPAAALEYVVARRAVGEDEFREEHISGKLLIEAEDGGLLLQTAAGALVTVTPEELVKHSSDRVEFRPLTSEQIAAEILQTLPDGFKVHTTTHYVVIYNTTQAYAQWCGALYERLYKAFTNFWTRKGFKLHDPEFPLVAMVFADSASYRNYAQAELGEAAGSIIGYYSLQSNRVTMYDLTGAESLRQGGDQRGSTAQINRMLSRPAAEPMVATIIHEATHQIAFNCGMQTRYADIPVWLSEGLAVYFETPDLSSGQGWRSIGAVNYSRLNAFRQNLPRREVGSLAGLLANDTRMREVRTAATAYAEAWALNYYLIRHKPKQFTDYMKMLSEKGPLVWDDEKTRLAEFKQFFGDDLGSLETDFLRYMRTVK
jgi:hypothetical protein